MRRKDNSTLVSLIRHKEASLVLMIILLMAVITMANVSFLTYGNINDIMRSYSVHGIVAMGMLLVIITSGIDVSVGSMAAAVTVIVGRLLVASGGNILFALLVGCVSGIALGLVNGFFIAKLRIPAIVVTLGTLNIFRGAELYVTGGSWITGLPEGFIEFGKFKFLGIPVQTLVWLVVGVMTYLILNYTKTGRGVYAIGGNIDAAKRVGYHPDRIQLFVWGYLGLTVGIASVMHTSIVRHVDPNAFSSFELIVIAACVLGGANIFGGEGSILGTFLGVFILAVIENGLIMARVSSYGHQVFVGAVILVAVSIDVLKAKRQEQEYAVIEVCMDSKKFNIRGGEQ